MHKMLLPLFGILFFLLSTAQTVPLLPSEVPPQLLRGGLDVSVWPTQFAPKSSPVDERLLMNITNPTDFDVTIGLYVFDGTVWRALGERNVIGTVPARETQHFEIIVRLAYTGKTVERAKYAVITQRLDSAEFELFEDWSNYEARMSTWLRYASVFVAPTLALFLIAVMIVWGLTAHARARVGAYPGEYTLRTLFRIPAGRGFGETAALVLAHPMFWTFVITFAVCAMSIAIAARYTEPGVALQVGVLSAPIAIAPSLLLLIAAWLADRWEREPARFVVGMYVWGIVSAAIAFAASSALTKTFGAALASPELIIFFSSLTIAPIAEEVAKGAGVAIMSRHHELDDTTDGLLYGFAVGLGFAAIENWYYAALHIDMTHVGLEVWAHGVAYRSLFNTLAHGCFTAFVGALVGAMKARPAFAPHCALALVPGLFIAIVLHMIFNAAAFADIVAIGHLKLRIFNPLFLLIVVAGFIVVLHFANEETRERVRAKQSA